MTHLSLAMIVKNEAALLGHCLDSVRGLVDEMIVVDTGSEDGTVEIARSRGAKVHSFQWCDHFAKARNESLRHATGDWVLILDADEAIDPMDHKTIREALSDQGAAAYRLTLRNYHMSSNYFIRDVMAVENRSAYTEGREYPFYVDAQGLRLCRRIPDLAFTGRIHELLEPCLELHQLPIADLPAVIHHYGKLQETKEKQKVSRYFQWALEDLAEDPTSLQFHFNVIQQGVAAEAWDAILASSQHFVAHARTIPSVVLFARGLALQKGGRHAEAVACFDQLLKGHPGHAQALTHKGLSLSALGRIDAARSAFSKAVQVQPRFVQPYLNLAELERNAGRPREAHRALHRGLARCPKDPVLLNGLVLFDLLIKDVDQAMRDAAQALQILPKGGGGLWHQLVALSHIKTGNVGAAVQVLRSGLEAFPDDPDLHRLHRQYTADLHDA